MKACLWHAIVILQFNFNYREKQRKKQKEVSRSFLTLNTTSRMTKYRRRLIIKLLIGLA